ncbi:hypothetical protein M408DRAFT_72788 [Serendipita vermifera MAFF 305830]|uniref:Uncharacterized protein n=1 Tax=Serendipita vermifera MAFF 305830 TaxID=933852 RepID=A0A0C2WJ90_SERVB|nr:hypothetical protein M408DRAFT_72788 [Serendipita vermifera MAFF 305830]
MPTTSSNDGASGSRSQGVNETSPLLRARYSTGYNDPVPSGMSPTTGSPSWSRYIAEESTAGSASTDGGIKEMPSLMSFISLLPPPREMTYESMERVLPAGLSPSANVFVANLGNIAHARKTSFLLSSLLWLYLHPVAISLPRDAHGGHSSTGTWDLWRRMEDELKGRRVLLSLIKRVWGAFAESGTGRGKGTVEEVLWTEIPIEEGGWETIRVVDLATLDDAPTWFLSHPLVMISLRMTWSHGIPLPATRANTAIAFDRFSSPRITHAIFLVHHLVYLSVLSHLVLSPPSSIYLTPFQSPSYRELYLFLYSISAFPYNQAPTLSILPYTFVALALALAYPNIPTPNTGTHSLLLLSLSLFLLQLHLPNPAFIPTPLYLFEPKRILPLSTLVKGLLKQAVGPGMFFFGPVVILVGIVLTQALGDSLPLVEIPDALLGQLFMNWAIKLDASSEAGMHILAGQSAATIPTHPQTRITLIFLFLSSVGAMWTLINCLVMLFPGSVSSKGVLESRDEYEDFPIEPKSEGQTTPVPSTVAGSSTSGNGKNGGEGWKFQPSGTSARIDERANRSITSATGFSGGGPWERYGPATAMSAKRSFARVVKRYQHLRLVSTPFPTNEGEVTSGRVAVRKPCGRVVLPPVFNLLSWIVGTVPATLMHILMPQKRPDSVTSEEEGGRTGGIPEDVEHDAQGNTDSGLTGSLMRRWKRGRLNQTAEKWEGAVTRVIWRVVVGTPGLVLGGVRILQ